MIFGNKCKDSVVNIGNSIIKESDYEKLLGVTFDNKLNFTKHVEDLCKKANQKLHTLARLSNYMDPVKLKLLKSKLKLLHSSNRSSITVH